MKKYLVLFILSLFFLLGIFMYQYFSHKDSLVHVIFCNVGQGDAILVKSPNGVYFLIDAGPDQEVISCLERHMPFWKRTLSLAFLTHPHTDHFVGYLSILKRYSVHGFVHERLLNSTSAYSAFESLLLKKRITMRYGHAGDRYSIDEDFSVHVLGPSEKYLSETSPSGKLGESAEFANLVLLLEFKEFQVLLTGDSQNSGLLDAIGRVKSSSIDVLHVPHHGSRTGLSESILKTLAPSLSVISVGKNKYGHPAGETLLFLKEAGIKTLRTDQHGDIEIVSDGKKFWVLGQ